MQSPARRGIGDQRKCAPARPARSSSPASTPSSTAPPPSPPPSISTPGEGGGADSGAVELYLRDSGLSFSWPCSRLRGALGEEISANPGVPAPCSPDQLATIARLLEDQEIPEAKIWLSAGLSAFLFLYTSILGCRPGKAVVTSDLPMGAGLGSSSAFCVSMSGALLTAAGAVSVGAHRGAEGWEVLEKGDLELVNQWAFQGEKIIHEQSFLLPLLVDSTASLSCPIKCSAARRAPSLTYHTDSRNDGIHAASVYGHDLMKSISDLQEIVCSSFSKACLLSSCIIYVLPPSCIAEPCEQAYSLPNMPLLFAIAMVGATVGGLLARQRRGELARLNDQLRQINAALRRQAKIESYAPALSYASVGSKIPESEVIVDPQKERLIAYLRTGKNYLRNQAPDKAFPEFKGHPCKDKASTRKP
ncbi:uncharacterized protein [Miscanthus floridulus]|uniref:uncharacterized protein isoform X2 n=1 Tax=Miscanthus floridulus TaxID=154761 RepID=UPI003458451A